MKWIDGNSLFRAMTSSWSCVIRALKEDIKESNDAPALFPFISLSLKSNSAKWVIEWAKRIVLFWFGSFDLKETAVFEMLYHLGGNISSCVFITSFSFLYAMYGYPWGNAKCIPFKLNGPPFMTPVFRNYRWKDENTVKKGIHIKLHSGPPSLLAKFF